MTLCNFCSRGETRARRFTLPFTCKECEGKYSNYTKVRDDYSITYIDANGKYIKIDNDTEINIVNESIDTCNTEINKEGNKAIDTNDFKDALLASLYSQVEFLKNELHERNIHIRTLLSIIKDRKPDIYEDIAQNYVSRENISKSDMDDDECSNSSEETGIHTPRDGTDNKDIRNSTKVDDISTTATVTDYQNNENIDFNDLYLQYVRDIEEERDKSITLKQQLHEIRAVKHLEYNDMIDCMNVFEDDYIIRNGTSGNSKCTSIFTNNTSWKNNERFKWEKHSTGFASKIMEKMGYKGRGLGKGEDGILEPIIIENTKVIGKENNQHVNKRKTICFLSDSMLNQIDEKRLSNKYNVKVMCHGGCTIECMYTHVPSALKLKPKYIVLNVSTNDSVKKTSDVILRDLSNLKKYIENALPCCEVIIS